MFENNKFLLDYVNIPGHSFIYHNGDERRGGEVGANIKENIKFKERKDYYDIDTTIENISIEILDKKDRPLLIGALYSNPVPIKEKSYCG